MPGAADSAGAGSPRRLFLYVASVEGGIGHYAHYQAEELAREGVEVTMLCSKAYPWPQHAVSYRQLRKLPHIVGRGPVARMRRFLAVLGNHWRLAWHVARERADLVLLEANTEYMAFFWIWPLLLLRGLGVTFLAVFHDPHRQVRYGLPWLHRLELWLFYRILSGGLIHGALPAEAWVPGWIVLEEVPHGPFLHQREVPAAFDLRARLGIAADRFVLLSFGLIADYKNIGLLIEALADAPQVDLVIAGKVKSARERGMEHYRELARRHGVAGRVHLVEGFVPEGEVSAWFTAADAVALTYDRTFVSQSGVLQLAALWSRPVLASSGVGPLKDTVEHYGLGVFVEPDSCSAVVAGLHALCARSTDYSAKFMEYNRNTSWAANVSGLRRLIVRCASRPAVRQYWTGSAQR